MESKKGEKMSAPGKVALGAGIAALAAAAAGAIFLYGTEAGKKRRKEIKGWMLKMKGEVLEKMENMKDLSEDAYASIVDSVAKKYEQAKHIDPVELTALVSSLKSHWKNIQREIKRGGEKKKSAPKKKAKKSESSEKKSE